MDVEDRDMLKEITDSVFCVDDDDHTSNVCIDYNSAALYVIGLQVILATVSAAATMLVVLSSLPISPMLGVRALACTICVGWLMLYKPLRIAHARGLANVFNAARPCTVVYVTSELLQQLSQCCRCAAAEGGGGGAQVVTNQPPSWHAVVVVVQHVWWGGLVMSGLLRARHPSTNSNTSFFLVAVCLLGMTFTPKPEHVPGEGQVCAGGGLCGAQASSLNDVGRSLMRALLFALLYTAHTYAAAPRRNTLDKHIVCVLRTTAASVWLLCVPLTWTVVVIAQLVVLFHSAMRGLSKDSRAGVGEQSNDIRGLESCRQHLYADDDQAGQDDDGEHRYASVETASDGGGPPPSLSSSSNCSIDRLTSCNRPLQTHGRNQHQCLRARASGQGQQHHAANSNELGGCLQTDNGMDLQNHNNNKNTNHGTESRIIKNWSLKSSLSSRSAQVGFNSQRGIQSFDPHRMAEIAASLEADHALV